MSEEACESFSDVILCPSGSIWRHNKKRDIVVTVCQEIKVSPDAFGSSFGDKLNLEIVPVLIDMERRQAIPFQPIDKHSRWAIGQGALYRDKWAVLYVHDGLSWIRDRDEFVHRFTRVVL